MSSVNSEVTGPNFTQYRGIIYPVNAHIEIAISHSVSKRQTNKCRGVGNFCHNFATKLIALATSLKISEKEGPIDHLQFNTYQATIWCKDCENRSSRS